MEQALSLVYTSSPLFRLTDIRGICREFPTATEAVFMRPVFYIVAFTLGRLQANALKVYNNIVDSLATVTEVSSPGVMMWRGRPVCKGVLGGGGDG